MSDEKSKYLLPVEVIEKAVAGEPEAVQAVLKRYQSFIRSRCLKTTYDERGLVHYSIDQDKKDYMESRLIYAIVHNFRLYKKEKDS